MRDDLPIPKKLANAPQLLPGLEMYMEGFLSLHSCRAMGMSEGSIPWTAMQAYCLGLEMTNDESEEFHFLVRELDDRYLAHQQKKREQGSI